MELSIVIPTYNNSAKLRQTLDGILTSNFRNIDGAEVIVVDDGSSIPAEPVVQSARRPDCVLLSCRRQGNAGPAAARNHGFRVSKGNIVLFIDDDILVQPDLFSQHIEAHRIYRRAAIFGRCPLVAPQGITPLFRYLCSRGFDPDESNAEEFLLTDILASGQISFERDMFDAQSGVYNDSLATPAAEEYELATRLTRLRIPIYMGTRMVAWHNQEVSLESMCRQAFKHAKGCAEVSIKYPGTLCHSGLREIVHVNRPANAGDPPGLRLKKGAKRIFATRVPVAGILSFTRVMERLVPGSQALPVLYNTLLGLYAFAGLRMGLLEYATARDIPPLAGRSKFRLPGI